MKKKRSLGFWIWVAYIFLGTELLEVRWRLQATKDYIFNSTLAKGSKYQTTYREFYNNPDGEPLLHPYFFKRKR